MALWFILARYRDCLSQQQLSASSWLLTSQICLSEDPLAHLLCSVPSLIWAEIAWVICPATYCTGKLEVWPRFNGFWPTLSITVTGAIGPEIPGPIPIAHPPTLTDQKIGIYKLKKINWVNIYYRAGKFYAFLWCYKSETFTIVLVMLIIDGWIDLSSF